MQLKSSSFLLATLLGLGFAGAMIPAASAQEKTNAASSSAASGLNYAPYVTRSIEAYIRPHAVAFAEKTDHLIPAVQAACDTPTDETIGRFASAYRDTLVGFAGISFLRFGPVIKDNRLDALAFLPDPRSITERQIRRALAKRDKTLTSMDTLKEKSVALQGLTALQAIAFDTEGNATLGQPGEGSDFVCRYASAIAKNVSRIAQDIKTDWTNDTGYSAALMHPDPAHNHVRSSKDAIETIFNAIVTGLIVVKDQDLLPALGDSFEKSRPHKLPFSRSGNARAYIQAELDGLEEALNAPDFGPDLPEEFAWVPGSLTFEFSNIRTTLASISPPLKQAIQQDPKAYGRLTMLTITIDSLRSTAALSLAGAMDLTGGFNALDGD